MNILYISTSFPKPEKGSTIYTDLAETLHEANHNILVVVAEQKRNQNKTALSIERGFEVLRVVVGDYYDVGYIKKGIVTLKMPMFMKKAINRYLKQKTFDFVLFESPPITNAGLVAWAKRKFNCPSYLMLKDIFPQNAVDLGIMQDGGIIHKYFKGREYKLYKFSDIIGCMSDANRDYLLENNYWVNAEKVEIFPNTKKIVSDYKTINNTFRNSHNIKRDTKIFLFGGNMGRPQYVDLLCYAVKECKKEEDIFFLFIGRGTDRYKLENLIMKEDITNALILENLPRYEYEQVTRECDVGLVVLDPRFTIPNYPSRILTYFEYAKPVLAATDNVSDIKNLIYDANCGYWVGSYDIEGFVEKIKEMAKSNELKQMGQNGRNWIEEKLNIKDTVKILEKRFEKDQ